MVALEILDRKILRLRAGLTQHEAGQLIGVPSYEISRFETGRDSAVRGQKADRLIARLRELADARQQVSA